MWSIGIDSGSSTTKGVLFDGQNIIDQKIVLTGANPKRTMEEIHGYLKERAVDHDKSIYTVTTGYGRDLLSASDKKVTEITCHGLGAAFLQKDVRTVIDIGGQDSKVILLDRDGNVCDFLMNDKCAAGTGRFVEVIMRLLHQDLCDLDTYVHEASPTKISSMCTVFAESEVVGLLAQDVAGSSIASGVIHSICERTTTFARRLPLEGKVFFSGGLAQSNFFKSCIETYLKLDVKVDPNSQFAGAIGAAVIGYKKINK